MTPNVRISEIGLYLRCPRLVYFESLGLMPVKNDAMQILLRSLMLSISQKDDLEGHLREIASRLEDELPVIYEIDQEDVGSACRELEEEIAGIALNLAGNLDLLLPYEA